MQARLWLCAVALVGCATRPTAPTKAPTPASEAEEETADPELWAVADAVDPGPQEPLFDGLPKWLRSKVGARPDREVAVREIREALLAWDKLKPGSNEDFMMSLLSLGRGLLLAEQAVAGGVDDPELLLALSRVYSILSMPALASETGMFQQILQFMATAASQVKEAEAIDGGEVVAALRDVFKRAPLLHRRTAAELLRRHGEHPEVPRVLARLADDELARERFHGALQLREMAMTRLGARAKGTDHLDAALTCFKALGPECGDAALARGRELGSEKPDDKKAVAAFATRIEKLTELGQQARRLQVLSTDPRVKDPRDPDLTAGLERGQLLIFLGHYADARAQFEALKTAHPQDARPYAGLAKVAMTAQGDLTTGARWIEAGRKLASRDRDFFEVALGVFGSKLMTEVMPAALKPDAKVKMREMLVPILDDMKEYAAGYQVFEPARGAVLLDLEATFRLVLPLVEDKKEEEVFPVAVRELLARTKALAQKYPESADVRRMVHLAANLVEDKATALALVRAPLTGKLASDAVLQRARVQVWLDVVMLWDAAEELPAVLAAAKLLPTTESDWSREMLLATALALPTRATQDREAGLTALKMYEEVALTEGVPAEVQVVALYNSAAMLAWFGSAEAAKERYEMVLTRDPKSMPGLVGIASLFAANGVHDPKISEILATAAKEADNATLRVQSLAWLYTLAKAGFGDVEASRQAFFEVVNRARPGDVRGTLALGRLGAFSRGSWNVSMQWQASTGFQLINEMLTTQYLILPSPDIGELMAAAAAAKKGKPGKPAAVAKVRG